MATGESPKQMFKAEKLFAMYDERLEDIRLIDVSELSSENIEELCRGFEGEMNTLDSKKSSILSIVTRTSIRGRYTMLIGNFKDNSKALQTFDNRINDLLTDTKKGYLVEGGMSQDFVDKLKSLTGKLEQMNSNPIIIQSIKHRLNTQYEQCIQNITKNFINILLPVDIRDSINLIEKTLEEPELYSLPSLIMWRDTAIGKIDKIKNKLKPSLPKPIECRIIGRYESMIKKLREEILKLRTYPIPEPWQSEMMRKGMTHMIEGEFIFFVHPGLMEEMKPLEPFEIDPLPGGLSREEYDKRLMRLYEEWIPIHEQLQARGVRRELDRTVDVYRKAKNRVTDAFMEFPLLYRDRRTLEYLVNKNDDDVLLKEIFQAILRNIRHYKNNRIDIPSCAMDSNDSPIVLAPPKHERNIPIASGIDRGSLACLCLDFPSGVIVEGNNVITVDKYSHRVTCYRATDLAPYVCFMDISLDTPLSMNISRKLLYVCYYYQFSQFSMIWKENRISDINSENTMEISQCCCVASDENHLFVGTLKPSLILINTDTFRVEEEYNLYPIRFHTADKKNRYPWLQDMKTARNHMFCLFTGSPYPLQMFTLTGELVSTIIAEDRIVGAYSFNIHLHPLKAILTFYICDFWGNDVKVFNYNGKYIETMLEKGDQLGQVIRPTAIFIEPSGYITVCDLKEDNCLQRL